MAAAFVTRLPHLRPGGAVRGCLFVRETCLFHSYPLSRGRSNIHHVWTWVVAVAAMSGVCRVVHGFRGDGDSTGVDTTLTGPTHGVDESDGANGKDEISG